MVSIIDVRFRDRFEVKRRRGRERGETDRSTHNKSHWCFARSEGKKIDGISLQSFVSLTLISEYSDNDNRLDVISSIASTDDRTDYWRFRSRLSIISTKRRQRYSRRFKDRISLSTHTCQGKKSELKTTWKPCLAMLKSVSIGQLCQKMITKTIRSARMSMSIGEKQMTYRKSFSGLLMLLNRYTRSHVNGWFSPRDTSFQPTMTRMSLMFPVSREIPLEQLDRHWSSWEIVRRGYSIVSRAWQKDFQQ